MRKVVCFYLLQLILSNVISPSQGQPNIVKSLPGYPGDLPFTLETGYVGVGKAEEIQLFYYFFESERDVENDPLVLWLTGGPGCSALSAIFFEIGPVTLTPPNFKSDIPTLQINPYSATKVASVIFIDSPVGTGFSYTMSPEASNSSDTLQSEHLYDFLRKWLIEHPEFINIPLYVGGDSYSGITVPIVVQNILTGNKLGLKPKMNLKGYLLGNPAATKSDVDSINISSARFEFLYRVSLLSDELYNSALKSCNGDFDYVDASNTQCKRKIETMLQVIKLVNRPQVLEHRCSKASPRPRKMISESEYQTVDHHNFRSLELHSAKEHCRDQHYILSYSWADDVRVREALHVREDTVPHWWRCNRNIVYERNVPDVVGYHRNFTREYIQALIFSGDQDELIPYIKSLQWIERLNMSVIDPWRPWFVEGQVAGYVTDYQHFPSRLTFTTIKGGGHTAPEFQPRECLAMLERFFSFSPL